ncbi:MAG: hypothetical protein A7316_03750 [Candidatus Altiarchaeales archaeon WOR_SM1_86-2]|nr:MAG: hypothetical protein A7316_03750 [Candidatus Altiarchaeales archaeon WOR_SM1_86-2]
MKNYTPVPPDRHGIPGRESLWMPAIDSTVMKGELDERIRWNLEHIMRHVFHPRIQEKTYRTALRFMEMVITSDEAVTKEDIKEFTGREGIAKSTLYNNVIPKLADLGLIERNYLGKIASEWEDIVKTKRLKVRKTRAEEAKNDES